MTTHNKPDLEGEASLLEHLIELRSRIIRGVIGLGIVLLGFLPFSRDLYTQVALPLMSRLPQGESMIAIHPAGAFFAPLKLALVCAVVVSVPWLLYQAWAFVAPGLYKREKKLAMPLLISSVSLFYIGCAFAYFLVLPLVFKFLLAFKPDAIAITPDAGAYLDFILVIFLAFGASFQLPVAMVILTALGWVTPEQLKEIRGYSIVGIFVIAAIITPPDIASQLLLAIPMCLLYEAGIFASKLVSAKADDNSQNKPVIE